MVMAKRMHSLGLPSNIRSAPMLGVVRAAEGWVGINCLTGQHWLELCTMLGLPEFGEPQIAVMMGGPERAEFYARAEPLLAEQAVAEIVELCQALRIAAATVNDAPPYSNVCITPSADSSSTAGDSNARERRFASLKALWHSLTRHPLLRPCLFRD